MVAQLRVFLIILLALLTTSVANVSAEPNTSIDVAFSPNAGATEAIVSLITEAKHSIRLAAYSFTSKPIARALMEAHKRGIDVQVVLDKSNKTTRYTSATFIANVDIPVRINSQYAIMHNKYMVVDGTTVETGSFNYTSAAEIKNAENVLVIRGNPELANSYLKNWKQLWDEAEPYQARY